MEVKIQSHPRAKSLNLNLEPYAYLTPSMIILVGVVLVPLIIGISYAFRDLQLLDRESGAFIGFGNFSLMFFGDEELGLGRDEVFFSALTNTFWWTFYSVIFQFSLGLTLALMLDKPFQGRGLAQALIFLPWAVPSFLTALTWEKLFNPIVGPLPHWLYGLGLWSSPEYLLSDPEYALWGPIIASIWWGIPFFAITLLAALQSIPRDLYEAAAIDGANPVQRFFSITLPYLAPTMIITLMLRTVWIANSADLIVVMTKGGPAGSTEIVASYLFTTAFKELKFGYASAIAVVLLILLLAYALIVVATRQALVRRH